MYINMDEGGSGPNQKLDNTYEPMGLGTGTGLQVTSGASNDALGTALSLGVTANAWAGFFLMCNGGGASVRFSVTLRIGSAGGAIIVPDLYIPAASSDGPGVIFVPLAVAAGVEVFAQLRSSTASSTGQVSLLGVIRNSQSPALFSSMVALNFMTSETRVSSINVPTSNVETVIKTATSEDYDALMVIGGVGSTVPATSQLCHVRISIGDAAEGPWTALASFMAKLNSASPYTPHIVGPLIEKHIPAGKLIAAAILAVTTTDNLRVGLWAFKV